MGGELPPPPEFTCKSDMYDWLTKQTELLVSDMSKKFTPDANCTIGLANVAALCFYELNRFANRDAPLQSLPVNWFGFYLLQAPGALALGPFQGRPACTQIRVGRGVCGTAADAGRTLVVPNVHEFPGHIACDSNSESEVVVPIRTENGSVVGVIDVDSTVRGHFAEEDGSGLERIAAVLSAHLTFPMSRALTVNPSLAFTAPLGVPGGPTRPPAAAAAGDECEKLPPPPPTSVTGIPFFTVDVARPVTTLKVVSGWDFAVTRLNRIMTQPEQEQLQESTGISSVPEIQFACNTLRIGQHSSSGSSDDSTVVENPILSFDLVAALANAEAYYRSDEYREVAVKQLFIPVTGSWATAPYNRHDPNVDWAWRNNFFGVARGTLAPLADGAPGINWDLLKDQSLPIVLYDTFDIFEDDLHDNGMVRLSVKLRVMNSAFFVLMRHSVRIDSHELWAREVRIYHEFGTTNPASPGAPHIVFNEMIKKKAVSALEEGWKGMSEDQLCQSLEVLSDKMFMLVGL